MDEFVEEVRLKFQQNYNIDFLSSENIIINNMIFPNYYKKKILHITMAEEEYEGREFLRIINKIFGFQYDITQLSYYENIFVKIKPNDVVFDCGANLGIFALYAAYKGAQVYCFEPATLVRHYLYNTQRYHPNIHIIPYGISNKEGLMLFRQYDNPGASRLINCLDIKCHNLLYYDTTYLITLDEFVQQTNIVPNFIKIDTEGAELQLLMGARNTILQYKPRISVSFHPENLQYFQNILPLFSQDYLFFTKEEKYYDKILLGTTEVLHG